MRVNEIFYSIQGEGFHTGRPAIFLRLSGCNLSCPFCDTDHTPFREMSADEIIARLREVGGDCRHLVITGGEPALQLTDRFVAALHDAGFYIQIETNGTRPLPDGIDWVTCSPKSPYCKGADIYLADWQISEIKLVIDDVVTDRALLDFERLDAGIYFLQPCDTADPERNARIIDRAVAFVKAHPSWRLSAQLHKLLGFR